MNIEKLVVPHGIQYISQWQDYQYPKGRLVVDKGVTGCGYTEYCLTNQEHLVLCSPRRLLLENKRDQHQGDQNILYLENNLGDWSDLLGLKTIISDHILKCRTLGKPPKFMITYDSTKYLVDILGELGMLKYFNFVVDEFQSIFLDAFFKADIEFDFMEVLSNCQNVIFLSATPMLTKYLSQLEDFKNLKYQVIDWSKSGYVETIKVKREIIKSITNKCTDIIKKYKSGKFYAVKDRNGDIIQSKEAVFYVNSVTEIIRILRKSQLVPEEVNLLVADSTENRIALNKFSRTLGYKIKLGQGFKVGKIPLSGEPNKMFTFCTKTVYVGADFYSKCASSYVFADPNIESLALDISLDLPQIVGRQRCIANPWKNKIELFYKICRKSDIMTEERFRQLQVDRTNSTNRLLNAYQGADPLLQEDLIVKCISDITVNKYKRDFVGFSRNSGHLVYNPLIMLADERAWEVSQKEYQDTVSVTKTLLSLDKVDLINITEMSNVSPESSNFLVNFNDLPTFPKRMKLYCEFLNQYPNLVQEIESLVYMEEFKMYYDILGPEKCRAGNYKQSLLREMLENITVIKPISNAIRDNFIVGQRYPEADIKAFLQDLYNSVNYTLPPKATDLSKVFDIKRTKLKDSSGKWVNAFEILGLK